MNHILKSSFLTFSYTSFFCMYIYQFELEFIHRFLNKYKAFRDITEFQGHLIIMFKLPFCYYERDPEKASVSPSKSNQ